MNGRPGGQVPTHGRRFDTLSIPNHTPGIKCFVFWDGVSSYFSCVASFFCVCHVSILVPPGLGGQGTDMAEDSTHRVSQTTLLPSNVVFWDVCRLISRVTLLFSVCVSILVPPAYGTSILLHTNETFHKLLREFVYPKEQFTRRDVLFHRERSN